jgi:hypothetical protein|tara:strand:+ start:1731 stop:1898 length:168 start_codon:yes stop_codon:yes gene_type:complete
MLSHTSLGNYYKTIFSLVQHHKYSIEDIEKSLPYERDLYVDMLVDFVEDQKAQQK